MRPEKVTGTGSPEQLALLKLMQAETNISKLIHVGDIAYESGTFAQFENNYFALYGSLMSRMPFFTTPENHEYLTKSAAPYLAVHSAPVCGVPAPDMGRYYSCDWGDVHFVSLDSNLLSDSDASARMLAWLDADLTVTGKYWKIVSIHHPPYPTGAHKDDPLCALVLQNVNPIVERHGVQLMLTGHEHGYERSFPLVAGQTVGSSVPSTTYLISGGGGAGTVSVGSLPQCALSLSIHNYMRVELAGTTLTATAKTLDGSAIDRITLNPPPAVSAAGVVNAGDNSPNIAPGSLVSIFGQNFAIRGNSFNKLPLPNQMSGVSVTANGVPAPVVYVSPGQLNVQLPCEVSGKVTLQVSTANGSATTVIAVTPTAPAIMAVVSGKGFVSASNPAVQGGYITIYATGLGAPAGSCPTGQALSGAMDVVAPVQVLLGGVALQPSYAGLAPGFAGLNQINIQIPPALSSDVYSLTVVASGITSRAVSASVGAGIVQASSSAHDPAHQNLIRNLVLKPSTAAAQPAASRSA